MRHRLLAGLTHVGAAAILAVGISGALRATPVEDRGTAAMSSGPCHADALSDVMPITCGGDFSAPRNATG